MAWKTIPELLGIITKKKKDCPADVGASSRAQHSRSRDKTIKIVTRSGGKDK